LAIADSDCRMTIELVIDDLIADCRLPNADCRLPIAGRVILRRNCDPLDHF
jgi:hypothetical protein